jgi:hypothetical protein
LSGGALEHGAKPNEVLGKKESTEKKEEEEEEEEEIEKKEEGVRRI